MKQENSESQNYLNNKELAKKLQPIAIKNFYNTLWPDAQIIELDNDTKNRLAGIIDKGGADKLIRFKDGRLAFLAQRFRDWEHRNRNDFTIRDTELHKVINAFHSGGFIASFYAYAYSDHAHLNFYKFRLFRYKEAIEHILAKRLNRGWIPNKDGGHKFIAIPFSKLPRDLFLIYESRDKQTDMFDKEVF